jgi:hypothetical protein
MPWKVKAFASDERGRRYKTVAEFDDDEVLDAYDAQLIMYWVRNMDPGEKVVVRRFPPG